MLVHSLSTLQKYTNVRISRIFNCFKSETEVLSKNKIELNLDYYCSLYTEKEKRDEHLNPTSSPPYWIGRMFLMSNLFEKVTSFGFCK